MSDIAIKIENLSKQYRLGNVGTGTLTHDLKSWWATARGKEDPNLQIGLENKLAEKGGDYVYALKDINLEIKKGDIVGVIGKNGAGKSTLLKILSRVTTPTTGSIDLYGRVASLLEVGTGFHPELTGRENIFLNGAIMGMTKQEIKSKFDEIVEFAGVGKYIDTPVKRYSSGMYVRLAFAVAAHLDPEILIVDEVLAVGDVEFQKKALGKMQDVSKNEGRTVLFVSHNMGAIKTLCNKGILLLSGSCKYQGSSQDVINKYLELNDSKQLSYNNSNSSQSISISSVSILNLAKKEAVKYSEEIEIEIILKNTESISNLALGVAILNNWGNKIFTSVLRNVSVNRQQSKYILKVPESTLLNGNYSIDCAVFIPGGIVFDYINTICPFSIIDDGSEYSIYGSSDIGNIHVNCTWNEIN
ncbi:MAG: polysaccharide ABC transporter ATP-binding protein [Bacteroidota bacterium]|nr:polysaccharide ABC transporter ATP-binding protein [Bacteroidota bacterium]MDP3144356.1 polysaccharide ABC transporter ATP-binding protein [Bacteroidota bacterium]